MDNIGIVRKKRKKRRKIFQGVVGGQVGAVLRKRLKKKKGLEKEEWHGA